MAERDLTAVAAVKEELKRLASRDKELSKSSLAATALALARELDDKGNSATSRAMCAKAMLEVQNRLRELAPEPPKESKLDDLSARRAARRSAGSPAAKGSSRT